MPSKKIPANALDKVLLSRLTRGAQKTTGRELLREEVEQVWNIDRSEVIDNIYHFENGTLVLRPQHYDIRLVRKLQIRCERRYALIS